MQTLEGRKVALLEVRMGEEAGPFINALLSGSLSTVGSSPGSA